MPQTNPHIALEQPVQPMNCVDGNDTLFMSPVYERLETNIPKTLIGYSDTPFGDDLQLFPRHDQVQKYLEARGSELSDKVLFRAQVVKVEPVDNASWLLDYKDLNTGSTHTKPYDAVAVATGHFSVPYIPDIVGLQDWNRKYPGSISHSKYYRVPDSFTGKKVIVIGSSASGLDIASQISPICKAPLLVSQRSVSPLAAGFADDPNIEFATQIARVDSQRRSVTFLDSRTETDIDHLLFCTGYLYSMPFLQSLRPNPITTGTRVERTYKHLFYAPRPTLAFLTLNQKIIPFPLAEAQSAVLARVWSGRLTLPPEAEMSAWERSVVDERGDGGEFHTLKFPKDAEYMNGLYDWAASAEPRDGLGENEGRGKLPKRWGKYEYWVRENFPAIRKAFVAHGEERKYITKLEEVGFEYRSEPEVAGPGFDGKSLERASL